jgi:NDP-sugar pyrophosphorylase family protein
VRTQERRIERPVHSLQPFAFSGIHIIAPHLLDLLPQEPQAFSIITPYLDLAAQERLLGHLHDQDYWFDVGKPERLAAATAFLNSL